MQYGDETTKIIINTKGIKGEISKDLKDFLDAVNGQFSNSEFSDKIKAEVERIKRSSDVRREFMALYLHDEDIRREGISQGVRESIYELLQDLGEVPEDVKECIEKEKQTEVLNRWLKLAAKSESIDEFRKETKI